MTAWAVARLVAMARNDLARDLASESPTDARAGSVLVPARTNPVALAAYTLGWVRL